jgi:hypothetical protein
LLTGEPLEWDAKENQIQKRSSFASIPLHSRLKLRQFGRAAVRLCRFKKPGSDNSQTEFDISSHVKKL